MTAVILTTGPLAGPATAGGTMQLVSHLSGNTTTTGGNGALFPAMSADGRFVAFASSSADLVPHQQDDNGSEDVFLSDRLSGTVILVSHTADSRTTTGNSFSSDPTISADGRFVAFASRASNLVVGQRDSHDNWDAFLFDRLSQRISLVSHVPHSRRTAGNSHTDQPRISADGQVVAFQAYSTDLVDGPDTNGTGDIFVYERAGGSVQLISSSSADPLAAANAMSEGPRVSADGRFISFTSLATDLVAGQNDVPNDGDVFLFDRSTGRNLLVSRSGDGRAVAANGSFSPVMSADGRFIVFHSYSTALGTQYNDGNGTLDLFLFDRVTEGLALVSHTADSHTVTANSFSQYPEISADGGFIVFSSVATNLVPGVLDDNGTSDLFLFDRSTGDASLVSRSASSAATASGGGGEAAVSADGRFVAFLSRSTELVTRQVDVNEDLDVFLFDRVTSGMSLVSHTPNSSTTTGNDFSAQVVISATGDILAFASVATNLVPGQVDTNGNYDVFLSAAI